jgi:hypothetical protein
MESVALEFRRKLEDGPDLEVGSLCDESSPSKVDPRLHLGELIG